MEHKQPFIPLESILEYVSYFYHFFSVSVKVVVAAQVVLENSLLAKSRGID